MPMPRQSPAAPGRQTSTDVSPVWQDRRTGSGTAVRGRLEVFEKKQGEPALFNTLSGSAQIQ
jgi:hypothetical protein